MEMLGELEEMRLGLKFPVRGSLTVETSLDVMTPK